jgi:hypothetical protein
MAEHFTKTTVEAKFWCKKCGGPTMHYVYDGRRGGCQACIRRLEALPKPGPKPVQHSLFQEPR